MKSSTSAASRPATRIDSISSAFLIVTAIAAWTPRPDRVRARDQGIAAIIPGFTGLARRCSGADQPFDLFRSSDSARTATKVLPAGERVRSQASGLGGCV